LYLKYLVFIIFLQKKKNKFETKKEKLLFSIIELKMYSNHNENRKKSDNSPATSSLSNDQKGEFNFTSFFKFLVRLNSYTY
jgi:hypothetical protein